MKSFLKEQKRWMEDMFPGYEIVSMTCDVFHLFVKSLELYCARTENSPLPDIFGEKELDRIIDIPSLHAWILQNAHHICFSDAFSTEVGSDYDRFLVPLPLEWRDGCMDYFKAFSLLMQGVIESGRSV